MKRSDIQSVVESNDGVYLLFIDYEEEDSASAIGHVYRTSGRRDETAPPTQVLATSDTLRAMWASPAGSLWVASADGNVATTAKVKWTRPPNGADYKTLGNSPPWTATELPRLRADGLLPSIGVIWGTSDHDVYASAFGGHIYHWDGTDWTQVYEGPTEPTEIHAFGGTGPNDVFAVGAQRTILHFDGTRWRSIAAPLPERYGEGFTGVHSLASGEIFISSSVSAEEGRLLHGSSAGFTEFTRGDKQLVAMAPQHERLLFATGDGVAELIGREIRMIKSTFSTVAVFPGKGRVFFLEPVPDNPSYVEYNPTYADAPWWGMEY